MKEKAQKLFTLRYYAEYDSIFQEQTSDARVWSSGPLRALGLGQVHRHEETHGGVPRQLWVLSIPYQQSEYDLLTMQVPDVTRSVQNLVFKGCVIVHPFCSPQMR